VTPIAYKLCSLNNVHEIALVKTAHVALNKKKSVSVFHGSDK